MEAGAVSPNLTNILEVHVVTINSKSGGLRFGALIFVQAPFLAEKAVFTAGSFCSTTILPSSSFVRELYISAAICHSNLSLGAQ